MKVYVAVLLLTSYLTPKNIRMFWENYSDVHNDAVSNAIRRNRFLEIHQYVHICDSMNLQTEEKFAKLSEYFKLLNKSLKENFWVSYQTMSLSIKQWYPIMGDIVANN